MSRSKWGEKEEKGEGSESPGAKEEGKKKMNIVHRVGAELELSRNMCSVSRSYKTCAATRTLAFKRLKGEAAAHGLEGGDGAFVGGGPSVLSSRNHCDPKKKFVSLGKEKLKSPTRRAVWG
jgi:hypothetical protein